MCLRPQLTDRWMDAVVSTTSRGKAGKRLWILDGPVKQRSTESNLDHLVDTARRQNGNGPRVADSGVSSEFLPYGL
jgi:hypothetical protein